MIKGFLISKSMLLIIFVLLRFNLVEAQQDEFRYHRELRGVQKHWHRIDIHNELFQKVKQDFSDLRIYGFTENGDTIEAPYYIKTYHEQISNKRIACKIINISSRGNDHYYTLQNEGDILVTKIGLTVSENNYDYEVELEGSQDLNTWFSIINTARITSLKNDEVDFSYNNIVLPASKYSYYRIHIVSSHQPIISSADVVTQINNEAQFVPQNVVSLTRHEESKSTIIDLDLKWKVPIDYVKIHVKDEIHYSRKVHIQQLWDSTKTNKTWVKKFRAIRTETLSSNQNNEFIIPGSDTKKVRIKILNEDNPPLNIEQVELKSYRREIWVRLLEGKSYCLFYGNVISCTTLFHIFHSLLME